jgi:hypothetical protein
MIDMYLSDVVNSVPSFHTFWVTLALTTVRPNVWTLCLQADQSCSCLIANLTQLLPLCLHSISCRVKFLNAPLCLPRTVLTIVISLTHIFDVFYSSSNELEELSILFWTVIWEPDLTVIFWNRVNISMEKKTPYRGKLKKDTHGLFQILDHKILNPQYAIL